jgi:hypothetical protein
MALDRHFARFQHSIQTGELILAGRTSEPGDKTFGIAIFEAKDEVAARAFMESGSGGCRRSDDGGVASIHRGSSAEESMATFLHCS